VTGRVIRRPAHPVRLVIGAAAVAVALVVAVLVSGLGRSSVFDPVAVLGRPAPADVLPALNGGRIDLADLRGKAVLVNFWNTWCQPCQQEAPALAGFTARHADDPSFVMVGVVHDDTTDAVTRWVGTHDIAWQVALDPGNRAALDFGTTGQPETYAISPTGVIVGKRAGPASVDDLERLLALARGTR
jgi:cytochrome c biogenesis protein CcmG/thiol:disulfide interchange protein DsbE